MKDWKLSADQCALVVVDPQVKLMAAMPRQADTLAGIGRLMSAARILGMPVLLTLQYPKRLGEICPELAEAARDVPRWEKLAFSCCGNEEFVRAIRELRRSRVIVCGVESHVCVLQTVVDLMAMDRFVYVCVDAMCSRRDVDHEVAVERMRDCGAVITTVESAVFEMLREAGTESFKACLPLFK